MRDFKFRTLKANEIEIRPQSVKNGKANMLLYIDSRAVVKLLDETVGNMNWQSEFYNVNGQTMCKIGIYDEDRNIWVWKSDTGSESNVEAEKGLISDCYKRVLSRWGITELYSSPKISWDDDGYGNTGYKVTEIEYDENREISHLVIANRFNKEVFRWDINQTTQQNTTVQNKPHIIPSKSNKEILKEFCTGKKVEEGVDKVELTKFFNYYNPKMDTWRTTVNPSNLWNNWNSKAN